MTTKPQHDGSRRLRTRTRVAALAVTAVLLGVLAGCGGSDDTATPDAGTSAGSGPQILPVKDNPIKNTSSVEALTIDEVLVENNEDDAGDATADHLEISMSNTGSSDLTGFEVYYTFTDPKTGDTESYYAELPDTFTIAPGGQRTAHFDNTGATDHFPVSDFSLYYTDTNALDVTVEVSAADTATQTASVTKDAGGPETAD